LYPDVDQVHPGAAEHPAQVPVVVRALLDRHLHPPVEPPARDEPDLAERGDAGGGVERVVGHVPVPSRAEELLPPAEPAKHVRRVKVELEEAARSQDPGDVLEDPLELGFPQHVVQRVEVARDDLGALGDA
jgi:hypothetical protein